MNHFKDFTNFLKSVDLKVSNAEGKFRSINPTSDKNFK
jgi:hypothetical protein